MGLAFQVGHASEVFINGFDKNVEKELVSRFGKSIDMKCAQDHYYSQELAWEGWKMLQNAVQRKITQKNAAHLLSMEAWQGCYVPAKTEPLEVAILGEETPLAVASLPALVQELESFGRASKLPVDDSGLEELAARYDDDDLVDSDMDIQTYAALLMAAHEAMRRRQVLWVVK